MIPLLDDENEPASCVLTFLLSCSNLAVILRDMLLMNVLVIAVRWEVLDEYLELGRIYVFNEKIIYKIFRILNEKMESF